MNKTFLYFLTLLCFSIFINEQLSSQTNKVSFEKVSLIDVKSTPINSDFEIVDIEVDDKCFPFLGSYDDWTGEKKWRWLSLKKYLNEEFYDYLNQTVKVQDDAKKVSLYIHEFRLKQYLFFNPKGCYFRYEYELYYIEQNKKYSFFLKDTVKIKDVKKPSEVLDQISLSINKLVEGLTIDDFSTDLQ